MNFMNMATRLENEKTEKTPESLENLARRSLGHSLQVVESLAQVEYMTTPLPETRLAEVDTALEGFPVSSCIASYLAQSYDHLDALAKLLGEAHAQHMGAPYTLLRASFEAVGRGMWLLTAGSRAKMIERRLQLEWENMRKRNSLVGLFKEPEDEPTVDEYRARLLQLARDLAGQGSVAWYKNNAVSSTDCVQEGGDAFGLDPFMLSYWMMASGSAHSMTWALVGLHDAEEIPGARTEIGSRFRITSNTSLLADMFMYALKAHCCLMTAFNRRAHGQYDPPGAILHQVNQRYGLKFLQQM